MAESQKTAKATFAGGCFWCMEPGFDLIDGVSKTTVGYTGGQAKSPSYEQVVRGGTGHREAIEVEYDPKKVAYEKLLEVYWQNINPTQADGQFADRGEHYQTAIFYHNDEQQKLAEKSKQALAASGKFEKPIVTEILPAQAFYPAEEYHQDYYKKNPLRYEMYKVGSGRADYLKSKWQDK